MKRTVFVIEGVASAYIGYTSGRLWNGWATPHFEINEALQVMADYNKDNDNPMQYDDRLDRFVIIDSEGMQYEPLEQWKGKNIETEDGIKHLYGIGAYSWIWETVDRRDLAQQVEELIFYHDTYNYMDEYNLDHEEVVNSITKQFSNLDTFHKAICIMRNEDTTTEQKFEALSKLLK